MLKATKAAWTGTAAAGILMLWAAYGLAQQDRELSQRCISTGAPLAECQLRIHGR